jgi:hypothetical protein
MLALLKRQAISLLLFVIIVFVADSGDAQPTGSGNGGGHGKPCANPPCKGVPIIGIEALIAAGIIFGVVKMSQRVKRAK